MDDEHPSSLEQRVEQIEKSVLRLERLTAKVLRAEDNRHNIPEPLSPVKEEPSPESGRFHDAAKQPAQSAIRDALERRRAERPAAAGWLDRFLSTENWLNKVGIGLMLFSLAFLFKYSIDQGWLTPTVRLLFGLGLGIGLIFFSIRTGSKNRALSLVLFGGGVASFFITGFAAFQVFELISHTPAFVYLGAVTVFTFVAAIRQNESVLAIVGVLGGFATPFLLYTDTGTLAGLILYSSLLTGGALAIYFFRGWKSLLWTTVLGAWSVLGFGFIATAPFSEAAGDRWPMQLGILFAWLAFAIVPIYREILSEEENGRKASFSAGEHRIKLSDQHLFILITLTPLLVLFYSPGIWTLPDLTAGLIILAGALLYGVVAWSGRKSIKYYAPFHALAGILLLTISLVVLLDGKILLLALTAEALVLYEAGLRYSMKGSRRLAHALFVLILNLLVARLLIPFGGSQALLNPDSLTILAVIVAGALVSYRSRSVTGRWVYASVVHVLWLGLLYRELGHLENGQGIVSMVWGAHAVIIFVLGLLRNQKLLRVLGSLTLLIVVAKLFLVDLRTLEAIWRVLLFMGFGGIFLLLSYFFKDLLAGGESEES